MKVKPSQLSNVLGFSPAAISMAIKRDQLNKTLDGQIDLDDQKNYLWITKRLAKQGCQVPHKISALFQATPITDSEKSEEKNNNQNKELIEEENSDKVNNDQEEITFKSVLQKEAIETQRLKEKAQAEKATEQAAQEKIKTSLMRKELIKINPYARLLVNIVAAERNKILNMLPSIAQQVLDSNKTAISSGKIDTQITFDMVNIWQLELEKIYKDTDRELKNKVRQAKDQLIVIDDSEDIEKGAVKNAN